jgi:5-methylcytosine-specific restriction enzyme subunit McrC
MIDIEYRGKTLIIDAKYYSSSLQTNTQYGNQTIHSHNLYQIYTYVKNKDRLSNKSVSGMLLYANTEGQNPDVEYMMDGNKISVKTLDLNCPFASVSKQLNGLADDWLQYIGG